MLDFHDYLAEDGLGLAARVAAGDVSAAELLETAIAACEAVNPAINAVIEPMYDAARARVARASPAGPFGGVPFLMKDLGSAVAGARLQNGSRFFRDYVPDYDGEMVVRLHAAGLVTFGKTSTPELGLVGTTEPRLFGPTRNPWHLERTAGGSSGGSGAAVAAGIVPLASAGDGGGSIRIPASCNGLVGLKPSRGRNPSGPEGGEGWYGQVQLGVVSRSVRDTAAALDATAGGDPGMPYCAPPPPLRFGDEIQREPGRLRIAVCREALCCEAPIDAECLAGLDATARLLEDLGHEVEDAMPPLERMALGCNFLMRVLACTGAEIADAERLLGRRSRYDEFEPTTRAFANLARAFNAVDLTLANRAIEREMRRLGRFMEGYDVMLTPTLAAPPAPLGVFDPHGIDALTTAVASRVSLGPVPKWGGVLEQLVANNFTFVVSTMLANMSGEPSISLPLHWSADGLPVGMMFTARIYQEATLLRLAAQLEQARPWAARRAPHGLATRPPGD
jgi:amidase